jgi:hypothetical protein
VPYRLYRLAAPCDDPIDGDLLGVFDTFTDALDARDDDAVTLLESLDGHPMLACHTIVGPGAGGELTSHPVTSSLGDDQRGEPLQERLEQTRHWLRQVHTPRP